MLEISWYVLTFNISLHKTQRGAYWNSEQKTYCYLIKHEYAQEQQEISNF